jgi:hypothetical protein
MPNQLNFGSEIGTFSMLLFGFNLTFYIFVNLAASIIAHALDKEDKKARS